jgi:hypothetical protein
VIEASPMISFRWRAIKELEFTVQTGRSLASGSFGSAPKRFRLAARASAATADPQR